MTELFDENIEDMCTISLTDEDGNELEFEFIDLIEYEGKEYAVLLPVIDDGTGEVVILEAEETEDGMETFFSVEEESVLEAVYEIFKEKFKDEFDFVVE